MRQATNANLVGTLYGTEGCLLFQEGRGAGVNDGAVGLVLFDRRNRAGGHFTVLVSLWQTLYDEGQVRVSARLEKLAQVAAKGGAGRGGIIGVEIKVGVVLLVGLLHDGRMEEGRWKEEEMRMGSHEEKKAKKV